MATARERLREAAADLAESFYDLLREDLVASVVAQRGLAAVVAPAAPVAPPAAPVAAPRAAAAPPSPAPTRTPRADTLVAWLSEHGPSRPIDLKRALGWGNSTLFDTLKSVIERGSVVRQSGAGGVTYAAVSAAASAVAAPSVPKGPTKSRTKPPRRVTASTGDAIEAVVAFIKAHPQCRLADLRAALQWSEGRLNNALKEARVRGLVRLEGDRIKSRYFPVVVAEERDVDAESAELPVAGPRAPSVPPAAPRSPRTPSVPPPAPRPSRADASPPEVVDLLNELEIALADDMHAIRLGALLQAIVAEIRMLQPRFDEDHPVRRRLDGTVRRITAIRAERDLPFIYGLKRDATANWPTIALEARRRVAAFDADAAVGAPKAKPHAPKKQRAAAAPPDEVAPLPKLIAMTDRRAVLLVGGIKKNEVLEQVLARYGLTVEWVAMQGTNARAAEHLLERIRHGNVGAVVMLEGLTGTTQVRAVVEACKTAGVPFAYGGRAGTESLRSALVELEQGAAAVA